MTLAALHIPALVGPAITDASTVAGGSFVATLLHVGAFSATAPWLSDRAIGWTVRSAVVVALSACVWLCSDRLPTLGSHLAAATGNSAVGGLLTGEHAAAPSAASMWLWLLGLSAITGAVLGWTLSAAWAMVWTLAHGMGLLSSLAVAEVIAGDSHVAADPAASAVSRLVQVVALATLLACKADLLMLELLLTSAAGLLAHLPTVAAGGIAWDVLLAQSAQAITRTLALASLVAALLLVPMAAAWMVMELALALGSRLMNVAAVWVSVLSTRATIGLLLAAGGTILLWRGTSAVWLGLLRSAAGQLPGGAPP